MVLKLNRKYILVAFGAIVTILVIVGIYKTSNARTFQLFGGLTSRVNTNQKVVALTFDDGPRPGETEKVLRILKEKNVKATFMLIGSEIAKHPEQGRLIVADGHQVGNHSYTHNNMVFKLPWFYKNEVEKTDQAIRSIGYQGDIIFRPPYGNKFIGLPLYLAQHDRKTIMWDIEPESNRQIASSTQAITADVLKTVHPGSIIILHVMYKNREAVMQAVKPIIDGLNAKGYQFVTVNELLKYN